MISKLARVDDLKKTYKSLLAIYGREDVVSFIKENPGDFLMLMFSLSRSHIFENLKNLQIFFSSTLGKQAPLSFFNSQRSSIILRVDDLETLKYLTAILSNQELRDLIENRWGELTGIVQWVQSTGPENVNNLLKTFGLLYSPDEIVDLMEHQLAKNKLVGLQYTLATEKSYGLIKALLGFFSEKELAAALLEDRDSELFQFIQIVIERVKIDQFEQGIEALTTYFGRDVVRWTLRNQPHQTAIGYIQHAAYLGGRAGISRMIVHLRSVLGKHGEEIIRKWMKIKKPEFLEFLVKLQQISLDRFLKITNTLIANFSQEQVSALSDENLPIFLNAIAQIAQLEKDRNFNLENALKSKLDILPPGQDAEFFTQDIRRALSFIIAAAKVGRGSLNDTIMNLYFLFPRQLVDKFLDYGYEEIISMAELVQQNGFDVLAGLIQSNNLSFLPHPVDTSFLLDTKGILDRKYLAKSKELLKQLPPLRTVLQPKANGQKWTEKDKHQLLRLYWLCALSFVPQGYPTIGQEQYEAMLFSILAGLHFEEEGRYINNVTADGIFGVRFAMERSKEEIVATIIHEIGHLIQLSDLKINRKMFYHRYGRSDIGEGRADGIMFLILPETGILNITMEAAHRHHLSFLGGYAGGNVRYFERHLIDRRILSELSDTISAAGLGPIDLSRWSPLEYELRKNLSGEESASAYYLELLVQYFDLSAEEKQRVTDALNEKPIKDTEVGLIPRREIKRLVKLVKESKESGFGKVITDPDALEKEITEAVDSLPANGTIAIPREILLIKGKQFFESLAQKIDPAYREDSIPNNPNQLLPFGLQSIEDFAGKLGLIKRGPASPAYPIILVKPAGKQSAISPRDKGVVAGESQPKEPANAQNDKAALAKTPTEEEVGGIDFNPSMLNLQTQGSGKKFNIPADPSQWSNTPIDGLTPLIYQLTPLNLQLLLNSTGQESADTLSKAE